MRDLFFKNLTSSDKKRRVIATSEVSEAYGVRSIIQRHFICIAREQDVSQPPQAEPYMYILRARDTLHQKEKFLCKIKGNLYVASHGKLFLVRFMHSLKINLSAAAP